MSQDKFYNHALSMMKSTWLPDQSLIDTIRAGYETIGHLPSRDEILLYLYYHRYESCRQYLQGYKKPDRLFWRIMVYGIKRMGIVFDARDVADFMRLAKFLGRFPTVYQFDLYVALIETISEISKPHTRLPKYQVFDEKKNNSATCSVCMNDLKTGENFCQLKCGHVFHPEPATLDGGSVCSGLIEWVKKKPTCPNCRAKIIV